VFFNRSLHSQSCCGQIGRVRGSHLQRRYHCWSETLPAECIPTCRFVPRSAPRYRGIDAFQAERSPDKSYRTAPLKGLWTRGKRGYYHDGRFATLDDVVNHYDEHLVLGLTGQDKADLVQYLRSL